MELARSQRRFDAARILLCSLLDDRCGLCLRGGRPARCPPQRGRPLDGAAPQIRFGDTIALCVDKDAGDVAYYLSIDARDGKPIKLGSSACPRGPRTIVEEPDRHAGISVNGTTIRVPARDPIPYRLFAVRKQATQPTDPSVCKQVESAYKSLHSALPPIGLTADAFPNVTCVNGLTEELSVLKSHRDAIDSLLTTISESAIDVRARLWHFSQAATTVLASARRTSAAKPACEAIYQGQLLVGKRRVAISFEADGSLTGGATGEHFSLWDRDFVYHYVQQPRASRDIRFSVTATAKQVPQQERTLRLTAELGPPRALTGADNEDFNQLCKDQYTDVPAWAPAAAIKRRTLSWQPRHSS